MKLRVNVSQLNKVIWDGAAAVPLEIGRQQENDSAAIELQDIGAGHRLVIAPRAARAIPRLALRVDLTSDSRIRITNLHSRLSFLVGDGDPFGPGEHLDFDQSTTVILPDNYSVRVSLSGELGDSSGELEESRYRTVATHLESTMKPFPAPRLKEIFGSSDKKDQGRVAVDLVRLALDVVQQAAGTSRFFDSAIRAVASMIDLDRALILLRKDDQWVVQSSFTADRATTHAGFSAVDSSYSRGLTDRVLQSRKTVIYDPAHDLVASQSSIVTLDRAVAAPLTNEHGEVIGAIYGDRKIGAEIAEGSDQIIGDLEAALLDVMAGAVSSGMARQRQEELRSNFSQFFSQEVAERLEQNEDLLAGREAEVTVMFCDIRGYSTIAERVDASVTINWIHDILTDLSECVTATDGVLVDYIGDELMAMWGAPAEQSDHAERACTAALAMLKRIEPLRERWKEITPNQFGVGIGINTGIAAVGNTGSKIKFKYGPLGNMVNLASRVQGITKKLGVTALITDSTAGVVHETFDLRRVAVVQPLGFAESVALHELKGEADDTWRSMASQYESALHSFENGNLTDAAQLLATLVHDHPDDNPCVVLLGRVVEALTRKEHQANPVWVMESK